MPATFTEDHAKAAGTRMVPAQPPQAPATSLQAFLAELLDEQQQLQTPVVRAAAAYSARHHQPSSISHRTFSDLIPLSAPAAGEQYAFEVDLDACSGCKACVAGCHSLNGLDERETWRDVGVVTGSCSTGAPFQQTITTACHHCADPGCLNGCPVLAYEKDPVTGIVSHLDDQCIGCQYCVLKCPYDVPKFNARLGIVRKCDMCHQRLAVGEAPACVQACPTHAIRIVKVPTPAEATKAPSELTSPITHHPSHISHPTSSIIPNPAYTQPTTRYITKHTFPDHLRAGDADTLRPQHGHPALVALLVLTQMSVGLLVASAVPDLVNVNYYLTLTPPSLRAAALVVAAVGLAASVLHLGQPLRAWRVFLNLRRSWLSREAVVFGGYFGLLFGAVSAPYAPWPDVQRVAPFLSAGAVATGLVGVLCSAMIYVDTQRRFWRFPQSAGRMLGTVAVSAAAPASPFAGAALLLAKLGLEASTLHGCSHSARLQRGPLRRTAALRFAIGLGAVAILSLGFPVAGLLVFALGELFERHLFFRAVDTPKMPGMPLS